MKRFILPPLFALAVAYILGICLASYLNTPLLIILLLLLGLVFLLIAGSARHRHPANGLRRAQSSRGVAGGLLHPLPFQSFYPYLLFFLLGLFLTSLVKCSLEKSLLLQLAHREEAAVVVGKVKSGPKRSGNKVSFNLKVTQARVGGQSWRLSELTRVVASQSDSSWLGIHRGQRVKISGNLAIPKSFNSEFDYKCYLYHQRIQTLLYTSYGQIEVIERAGWLDRAVFFCRSRIRDAIQVCFSGNRAGLLMGITLGDTSHLSENLKENFRLTGLAHILAVSGLHVGLLAAVCFSLGRLVRMKGLAQWAVVLSVVVFYALLTGSRPPALRASIMILVGGGAWLLGRDRNLISSLSVAALVLLIYDPFSFFDVGFQLSFTVALALILITPTLSSKIALPGRLGNLLAVSVAAQLGAAPILIYYFRQLPIIATIANLAVVPAVAPALFLGLVGGLVGMFSKVLSFPIYLLARPFLSYIIGMTSALGSFPGATLFLEPPHPGLIVGYYLALIGGVMSLRKWNFQINFRGLLIIFLVVAVLVVWWQVGCGRSPERLTVTFLDVGEGDAALVRTPDGANMLIDGGGDPQTVRQALVRKGVNRLDLLVLTHPHADHVRGLVGVVERFSVKLVLDGGQPHPSFFYRRFLKTIEERHIPYQVAREGQKYQAGEKLKVAVLGPATLFKGTEADLNNNSVVLKLDYGEVSFLFTGDIETEAQAKLVDGQANQLNSTILKIPHHGSSKTIIRFLKAVSPQVAIVSVGAGNPYGHPSRSTLTKLKKLGARTYRTDKDGDVTIVSDGSTYKVVVER